MSNVANVNAFATCHESGNILGTLYQISTPSSKTSGIVTHKAVPNGTNLLEALLLQILDRLLNNGINSLVCVWVVSTSSLRQPRHQVEAIGPIEGEGIAIEKVWDDGIVPVGGVLVCHQLGVLPDTDDVWEEEDRGVLVDGLAGGLGDYWTSVGFLVQVCRGSCRYRKITHHRLR